MKIIQKSVLLFFIPLFFLVLLLSMIYGSLNKVEEPMDMQQAIQITDATDRNDKMKEINNAIESSNLNLTPEQKAIESSFQAASIYDF